MNPKSASGSAAGPKSSASGLAASSFVALSDTAETGSKSVIQLGPMQKILIDTFEISPHLLERKKTTDLRLTYAKYLAIQKMIEDVGAMERAATWTHQQKPTIGDIAEVFMSRSGYFHRPAQLFPKVVKGSELKKWLEGGEDAPAESDVWGDIKPSFKNLEDMLDGKKKKVTNHKRKQKNEVVVEGKGKEKAKTKKAGEGSKKKAGSKKSHQNDD